MKKSQAEATTAKNLEAKFDRGEEVLDYFDVRKARLVEPAKGSAVKRSLRIRRSGIPSAARLSAKNQALTARKKSRACLRPLTSDF